jgi:uncharacterized membrane protein YgcG
MIIRAVIVLVAALMYKVKRMPTHPKTIEVGAADDSIRYWLAKEAIRQGDLAIVTQISAIQSLATRATAILGWSVTVSGALIAAAVAGPWKLAAGVATAIMFLAAFCCFVALWPRDWKLSGHSSRWLLSAPHATELEVLESMALGYAEGSDLNSRSPQRFARWLRAAWIFFLMAPLAGFVAWVSSPQPTPPAENYYLIGSGFVLGSGPLGSGCGFEGGGGDGLCAMGDHPFSKTQCYSSRMIRTKRNHPG